MEILNDVKQVIIYSSFIWFAYWMAYVLIRMASFGWLAAWKSADKDLTRTLEWLASDDHCEALQLTKQIAFWTVLIVTVGWLWSHV